MTDATIKRGWIIIFLVLTVGAAIGTECVSTNQSGVPVVTPTVQPITASTPATESSTATVAATPSPVVAALPEMKSIKDSNMLYTLNIPKNWEASDSMVILSGGLQGDCVLTNFTLADGAQPLGNGGSFWIWNYAVILGGQQQNVRTRLRQINGPVTAENVFEVPGTPDFSVIAVREGSAMQMGDPIPNNVSYPVNETSVTIHGRTFDRFEFTIDRNTTVVYSGHEGSENYKGFSAVIGFTTDTANDMNLCENISQSFSDLSPNQISKFQAEEVDNKSIFG